VEISDTKNLSNIYSYLNTSGIWSTGVVFLVLRLKSESQATDPEIPGSLLDQREKLRKDLEHLTKEEQVYKLSLFILNIKSLTGFLCILGPRIKNERKVIVKLKN
jgi:hypothetical protein